MALKLRNEDIEDETLEDGEEEGEEYYDDGEEEPEGEDEYSDYEDGEEDDEGEGDEGDEDDEEGEEADVDDEDEDEEDEDEEDEDDEDSESVAELLDNLEKDEDEYEGLDDDQIAQKVLDSPDYEDYVDSALSRGVEMSDDFLAAVGKHGVDSKYLQENEIFDFKTMYAHMEEVKEKNDPNAVLFYKNMTPDEEDVWFYENFGIPNQREPYDEAVEGIEGISDYDKSALVKELFEHRAPLELVKGVGQLIENITKNKAVDAAAEEEQFLENSRAELETVLGDDTDDVLNDVERVLRRRIPEFLDNDEYTKVVNNPQFILLFHSLIKSDDSLDMVRLDQTVQNLPQRSKKGLNKMLADVDRRLDKVKTGTRAYRKLESLALSIEKELDSRE